nr:probable RNA-dependent RNA polymerase 5 [Tanacetum cinerariifolium]
NATQVNHMIPNQTDIASNLAFNQQSLLLAELKFMKMFLAYNYVGRANFKPFDRVMVPFGLRFWKDVSLSLLREYRWNLLVQAFKDGRGDNKKPKAFDRKSRSLWAVKCYFMRTKSHAPWLEKEFILFNNTMHEARCLFMHVHMTTSIAKYISRCSLALSNTIRLRVDLATVDVQRIDDIPCRGSKDESYEFVDLLKLEEESLGMEGISDPPLLVQCRIFKDGYAVKGTLLVNKKAKRILLMEY